MSRVREDIDHLTARLTTTPEPASSRPELLTLLMGHLPVRTGLWRLPAARVLLPQAEAILVAREDEDTLVLECIGDCGCVGDENDPLPRLPSGSTCVLVPGSGVAPDQVADLESDRIALVTGADQAAIVGAYRLLKSIPLSSSVEIEVVIAGQELEAAREAASRLAEVAVRHLAVVVRFAGAIPTIDADTGLSQSRCMPCPADGLLGIARQIRRGMIRQPASQRPDTSRSYRALSAGIRPEAEEMPEAMPGPLPVAQPEPIPTLVPLESTPDRDVPDSTMTFARLSPTVPTGAEAGPAQAVPTSCADAVIEPLPGDSPRSDHVPGLEPLPVRCPGHEVVELARDESGLLHLVVSPAETAHVPVVLGWIARHQELLGMAVPQLHLAASSEPMVHVVGEDVDVLCGFRDTSWKPHLLVRADAAGADGWTCVALGRE